MTETVWHPIAGTGGRYSVSMCGRVRRSDGLELKQSKPRSRTEYPAVMLRHHGRRRRELVHRLVAQAFVAPFGGEQVRHLDGDHMNAHADNLAWGTAKQNAADRDAHGTTARGPRPARKGKATGSANGNYSVTPEMRKRVEEELRKGASQRQAAKAAGVSQRTVWRIAAALRALAKEE